MKSGHTPHEGQEEAYVDAWKQGSDVIQTYPGARGTKLFKKVGEPTVLIAMAEWESEQSRSEAFAAIKASRPDADFVLSGDEAFAVISLIGGFDLIDRADPPNSPTS